MKNNREVSLAEKIAKLLDSETRSSDVAALFAAVERLERRLDKLENSSGRIEATAVTPPVDASRERFAIPEAVADIVFNNISKEKTCSFEPNGRPCDHCAMCSSRGF